jgi:hypothetical protein
MRNKKSRGLFDDQFRLDKISKLKDPLEKLNRYIKWEDFRSIIDQAFRETEPSLGGIIKAPGPHYFPVSYRVDDNRYRTDNDRKAPSTKVISAKVIY